GAAAGAAGAAAGGVVSVVQPLSNNSSQPAGMKNAGRRKENPQHTDNIRQQSGDSGPLFRVRPAVKSKISAAKPGADVYNPRFYMIRSLPLRAGTQEARSVSNGISRLGMNHQTAPVAVRERVSSAPASMRVALNEGQARGPVAEVVNLSTCNRTETCCSSDQLPEQTLVDWLSQHHQIDRQQLNGALYYLQEDKAVQHAMRVASGLDSLVLGEPQIRGQMKSAYAVAQDRKGV